MDLIVGATLPTNSTIQVESPAIDGGVNPSKWLVSRLFRLFQAGNRWLDGERGRFVASLASHSITGILTFWLGWQIYSIGWREVWRCFPQSPMYYLLFVILLCQLPVTKTLSYRLMWEFPFWSGLAEIYKAIIYNRELGAGVGEFYLYRWAHRELAVPTPNILRAIKDLSIVWWVCDTVWTIGLVSACCALGVFPELSNASPIVLALYGCGVGVGLILAVLISFHRAVFWLPPQKLLALGAIYLTRLGSLSALTLAQWSFANPDVPLVVWWRVLALLVLIQWVPGLPNPQVLACAVGISLADSLGLPPEQLAGILLVNTVLNKCVAIVMMWGLEAISFTKINRAKPAPNTAAS